MEARLLSGGEGKEDTGELVTTEAGGGVGANSWLSVCTYDVHVSSAREHYRCVLSCSRLLALCISSPPHFSPPPILPHWRSRKAKECTHESVPTQTSGSVSLECAPMAMSPLWQQYILQHITLALLSRQSSP